MKKEIKISYQHKHQLVYEFGVTLETVRQSLCYILLSEKSHRIRGRAKQLLSEELDKVNELLKQEAL